MVNRELQVSTDETPPSVPPRAMMLNSPGRDDFPRYQNRKTTLFPLAMGFSKKTAGNDDSFYIVSIPHAVKSPSPVYTVHGEGRSLYTVFWRVGGGSGVFPRKLPAPGGGSPRPNPHPALRAPLPIKWGGEKHRIYNDIGNRVTLPPVIFYSPMGKGGGWGFPCKTLRKFTDFQQPIGAVPGSPPPLIWFRRAGPRHRPIRGRCRPARRDANPARRHRPAHRDGVAGRWSCPQERSPGPASRCAPAPPPAR